jgi:hypothetical protein
VKFLYISLLFAFVAQSGVSQVTILQHVNVIDGTGHPVKANQFVTITGDKITAITNQLNNVSAANAIRIDMTGKSANVKRETENVKRETANVKRQTANGKRKTENGKRETANGNRQ